MRKLLLILIPLTLNGMYRDTDDDLFEKDLEKWRHAEEREQLKSFFPDDQEMPPLPLINTPDLEAFAYQPIPKASEPHSSRKRSYQSEDEEDHSQSEEEKTVAPRAKRSRPRTRFNTESLPLEAFYRIQCPHCPSIYKTITDKHTLRANFQSHIEKLHSDNHNRSNFLTYFNSHIISPSIRYRLTYTCPITECGHTETAIDFLSKKYSIKQLLTTHVTNLHPYNSSNLDDCFSYEPLGNESSGAPAQETPAPHSLAQEDTDETDQESSHVSSSSSENESYFDATSSNSSSSSLSEKANDHVDQEKRDVVPDLQEPIQDDESEKDDDSQKSEYHNPLTVYSTPNEALYHITCPYCDFISRSLKTKEHLYTNFEAHLEAKHYRDYNATTIQDYFKQHYSKPIPYTLTAHCMYCDFTTTSQKLVQSKTVLIQKLAEHIQVNHPEKKLNSQRCFTWQRNAPEGYLPPEDDDSESDSSSYSSKASSSSESIAEPRGKRLPANLPASSSSSSAHESERMPTPTIDLNTQYRFTARCPLGACNHKIHYVGRQSDQVWIVEQLKLHVSQNHPNMNVAICYQTVSKQAIEDPAAIYDSLNDAQGTSSDDENESSEEISESSESLQLPYTYRIQCPNRDCNYVKENEVSNQCSNERAKRNALCGLYKHMKDHHWERSMLQEYMEKNIKKIKE